MRQNLPTQDFAHQGVPVLYDVMTVALKQTFVLPIETHVHVHRENAAGPSGSLGCFRRTDTRRRDSQRGLLRLTHR